MDCQLCQSIFSHVQQYVPNIEVTDEQINGCLSVICHLCIQNVTVCDSIPDVHGEPVHRQCIIKRNEEESE
jgi:hypothetical protein